MYKVIEVILTQIITATLESAPPAPSAPRLSRQRSRPLGVVASVDQNAAPASAPSAPSLDGTFNVNSIEDDPIDTPVKPRSGFHRICFEIFGCVVTVDRGRLKWVALACLQTWGRMEVFGEFSA